MQFIYTRFMVIVSVCAVAGCGSLPLNGLAVTQANSNSLILESLMRDAITRPIKLITSDGQIISQSLGSVGPINFRLPQTQQAYRLSHQCLHIQSGAGEILPVIGNNSHEFLLPAWQATLLKTYGTRDLTNERRQILSSLQSEKKQLNSAAEWIQQNPGIYSGGACIRPQLGPMPIDACNTKEAANERAISWCGEEAGCSAISLAGRQLFKKDNQEIASFLVAEGCVAQVLKNRGEKYFEPKHLIQLGLEALAEIYFRNELIEAGYSEENAALLAKGMVITASFFICVNDKASLCTQKYKLWLRAPEVMQNTCGSNKEIVADFPTRISLKQERLQAVEAEIREIESAPTISQQRISIARCDRSQTVK